MPKRRTPRIRQRSPHQRDFEFARGGTRFAEPSTAGVIISQVTLVFMILCTELPVSSADKETIHAGIRDCLL